jgi:hypothetical protein
MQSTISQFCDTAASSPIPAPGCLEAPGSTTGRACRGRPAGCGWSLKLGVSRACRSSPGHKWQRARPSTVPPPHARSAGRKILGFGGGRGKPVAGVVTWCSAGRMCADVCGRVWMFASLPRAANPADRTNSDGLDSVSGCRICRATNCQGEGRGFKSLFPLFENSVVVTLFSSPVSSVAAVHIGAVALVGCVFVWRAAW